MAAECYCLKEIKMSMLNIDVFTESQANILSLWISLLSDKSNTTPSKWGIEVWKKCNKVCYSKLDSNISFQEYNIYPALF